MFGDYQFTRSLSVNLPFPTLPRRTFFFGILVGLTPLLPTGFIPADDLSQTQISLTLPPGSTLSQSSAAVARAEALAWKNPHVKTIYTAIGGGASGSDPFASSTGGSVNKATLTINLTPRDERSVYQTLFRCPPIFNSAFNGLLIRRSDLDLRNPQADEQLALHARQLLKPVVGEQHVSCTEHVEQLIRIFLPSGKASVQICAATLGMTVRTLQRTLDAEGTCFTELLNQSRRQLAQQYLSNPRMRVTDIADLLGYTSIGAFSRWHKSSFGRSPKQGRSGHGPT